MRPEGVDRWEFRGKRKGQRRRAETRARWKRSWQQHLERVTSMHARLARAHACWDCHRHVQVPECGETIDLPRGIIYRHYECQDALWRT